LSSDAFLYTECAMTMRKFIFIFLLCLLPAQTATGEVLTEDTIWQGEVTLSDDLLVPSGVTLTITAGTTIIINPAESTKIDPEYISHYTEILVRGSLRAEGTVSQPISFHLAKTGEGEDRWAGIIVDHGEAYLTGCEIRDAETGLYVVNGKLEMDASRLFGNRYGIIAQGEAALVSIRNSLLSDNEYGLLTFGKVSLKTEKLTFNSISKKDVHEATRQTVMQGNIHEYQVGNEKEITRIYKDEALVGQTIWKGRVVINGIVRVPPEARLIILPGTLVEIAKRDTNSDGIGENGILVQGHFIAKGTPQQPIIFRSAETTRKMGDWDAINILGSDRGQNIIEFCQIEDAYRALHFHFSNVIVTKSILRNNYRGAQFQESLVEIRESYFYRNKSGVQARDSEAIFRENLVFDNHTGANFFRMNLELYGNTFANNNLEGLRLREGTPRVMKNQFLGNRYGLLVADAVFGEYSENLMAGNLESGISLRNTDHIKVVANFIQQNAINGINIQDSRTIIQGNLVSLNGERGVAVQSFTGRIEENNITSNGLYGIGLDGPGDVSALNNWWADSDMDAAIFDSHDESSLGTVTYQPRKGVPFEVVWPFKRIVSNVSWSGAIGVPDKLEIDVGAELNVLPGTVISFGPEGGLHSHGRIMANGTKTNRIQFQSKGKRGPGSWSEILIEQGDASSFSFCDFSSATWGLHLHLTKVAVADCLFTENDGGLRFRSGPVSITRSIFKKNRIGIRSYRGVGKIEHSEILENEIGIFIRERGGGFIIQKNNMHDNDRYNVRLGDFNTEDVDARQNWWGTDQPIETIFDDRIEPGIGRVNFDSFVLAPFPSSDE
jgi:hypothetical protein